MSWVLIVGASSGIGRALARRWAEAGNDLILSGRDEQELRRCAADLSIRFKIRVELHQLDVLELGRHTPFWQECLSTAGGQLDGIILAHGFLPVQAETQKDLDLVHQTIYTNYTSAASLLTLASKEFELNRRGFICVFSSVAGDRGRQSNYVYGSAKAGLSAFLQGLRQRLFKCGVTVVTVKPGFVDTGMIWGLPGLFLVADPVQVAGDAYRAVQKRRAVLYTPWFWRYIMLVIRLLPESLFNRMRL